MVLQIGVPTVRLVFARLMANVCVCVFVFT